MKHIMVVEDHEMNRDLISRALNKQGWTTETAINGFAAIDQLRQRIPDLLILDLMMPEMNGFELLSVLKEHAQWKEIPVMIVTAKDLEKSDLNQFEGRVHKILIKGEYAKEDLIESVKSLLG